MRSRRSVTKGYEGTWVSKVSGSEPTRHDAYIRCVSRTPDLQPDVSTAFVMVTGATPGLGKTTLVGRLGDRIDAGGRGIVVFLEIAKVLSTSA